MTPATDLKQIAAGLPPPTTADQEIKMAGMIGVQKGHFAATGTQTIWTKDMGDCSSIATYDHITGARNLWHLAGSNAEDAEYDTLAKTFSKRVSVVVAPGTAADSEQRWKDVIAKAIVTKLKEARKRVNKDAAMEIDFLWTKEADDKKIGIYHWSFGITAEGHFGRIRMK